MAYRVRIGGWKTAGWELTDRDRWWPAGWGVDGASVVGGRAVARPLANPGRSWRRRPDPEWRLCERGLRGQSRYRSTPGQKPYGLPPRYWPWTIASLGTARRDDFAAESATATGNQGRAVASHRSAALIHGLDLLNAPLSDMVMVSRPPGVHRGRGKGIRFYSAQLPGSQVVEYLGVPVTTPARTVLDMSRKCSFIEGVVVADSALRQRKTTKAELDELLKACQRTPGMRKARRVVEFSDGRSESVLESGARVIFERCGLEPPELQVTMETDEGRFRVDFYWRRYRTIAEADGRKKYENPGKARDQLVGDQLLRDTGRKVIHFTWQDLFYEEDRLIRRLQDSVLRVLIIITPMITARTGMDDAVQRLITARGPPWRALVSGER